MEISVRCADSASTHCIHIDPDETFGSLSSKAAALLHCPADSAVRLQQERVSLAHFTEETPISETGLCNGDALVATIYRCVEPSGWKCPSDVLQTVECERLALSPDGQRCAVGSMCASNGVIIHDMVRNASQMVCGAGKVQTLALLPGCVAFALCRSTQLVVTHLENRTALFDHTSTAFSFTHEVRSVAGTPCGGYVVVSTRGSEWAGWAVQLASHSRRALSCGGSRMVVSPEGKWVACSSEEGVCLLSFASGSCEHVLMQEEGGEGLAFSRCGALLAGTSASGLTIWHTTSGVKEQHLDVSAGCVEFSFCLQYVFVCSQGVVSQWDLHTGNRVHIFKESACGLLVSPDAQYVAIGNANGLHIREVPEEEQRTPSTPRIDREREQRQRVREPQREKQKHRCRLC